MSTLESDVSRAPPVWGPADFERCLEQVRPRVGRYGWMRAVLRMRARKHGGMFPARMYGIVRRYGNPRRPYFLETTADGIRYVGDYRDIYPIVQMTDPGFQSDFTCYMQRRLDEVDGMFVDVGTNMGVIAASVAKHLAQGGRRVIAFEPMAETATRAAATFALNGLTNLSLYVAAVGELDGEVSFFSPEGGSDRASVHASVAGEGKATAATAHMVPCVKLDTLAGLGRTGREGGAWPKVGLMKLDVEGHEPQAIRGALGLLRRDRPVVIFEYSYEVAPRLGWRAEDVAELIGGAGAYRFGVLGPGGRLGAFPPPAAGSGSLNVVAEPVG